jgi:hypothetical protein
MSQPKFGPSARVLAALAVAVALAAWFTRQGPAQAPPAGTGPGVSVAFAGTGALPAAGPGGAIGVTAAAPPSLPAGAVTRAAGALGAGAPALRIPDSLAPARARAAVRAALRAFGGGARLVMITPAAGEPPARYAARFTALYPAVKAAGPGIAAGAFLGEYAGTFLREFLLAGGSRADFVDFSFYGQSPGRQRGEQWLLGEQAAVTAQISAARSVIAAAAPGRARAIAIDVGPWNITAGPDPMRFTSFAALWDAGLLGRILSGGAGSLADGSGLLYDGDGTAPRAYQPGDPSPLYAAVAMFTGAGLFPRFGAAVPAAAAVSPALPGVRAFASASPDELVVINASGTARATVLHVRGDVPLRASFWRMGERDGAVSGPVSAGTATSRNGSFALSLPSGSVTTVVLARWNGGGAVMVRDAGTGQCLASDAAGTVATARCDGGAAQLWRLSGLALVSEGSGRCLAGDPSGRITASPCAAGLSQDWYNLGSRLVSAGTGRCLDGTGTAEVYALSCDGAGQQDWVLAP